MARLTYRLLAALKANKKFICLSLFAAVGVLLLGAKPVSALTPWDYPDWVRQDIRNYDDGCPNNPNKYWLWSWLSPEGQPKSNSVTVPYGTTSVNLWYQSTVFSCRDLINVGAAGRLYPNPPAPLPDDGTRRAGSLQENRNFIAGIGVSPDGGFNPSPVGNTSVAAWNNSTRYWFGGPIFFVYRPAGPLTASRTITVTMHFKGVNRFGPSTYRCTANGAATTFNNFPWQCPTTTVNFPIFIEVQPPDACPNIPGYQSSVPPGYVKNGAGNCIRDFTHVIDVYPNRPWAEAGETFSVIGDVRNVGSASSGFVAASIFGDGNAFAWLTFNNPDGTYAPNRYIYWDQGGLPPGGTTSRALNFTVNPDLPSNVTVCFAGHAAPYREDNYGPYVDDFPNNCILLIAPQRPYQAVKGGDLHAGTQLSADTSFAACANPPSSGTASRILGRVLDASRGTRGQYAVSATGQIQNYGSFHRSSLDGSGSLLTYGNSPSLGDLGARRVICRPDYMKLSHDDVIASSTNSINLTSFINGNSGKVIRWLGDGNTNVITGGANIPFDRRVTLLSEDPVLIDDNIYYVNPTDNPLYVNATTNIPSFMLVSASNIAIAPGVDAIAGRYVANGTISTCSTDPTDDGTMRSSPVIYGNPGGTSSCSSRLTIYGILEAANIFWRRTYGNISNAGGNDRGGDQAGELILFSPEYYLAPPPGTTNPVTDPGDLQARYDSDRPPLN